MNGHIITDKEIVVNRNELASSDSGSFLFTEVKMSTSQEIGILLAKANERGNSETVRETTEKTVKNF